MRDAEIQTSNFSIDTAWEGQPAKRHGFNVSNGVTVTREDPKIVSELIATAVDAGANEASGVNFFNSDPSVARDKAIERAIKDARAQAEKLAAAAGVTLGRVTAITTSENRMNMIANRNMVAETITVTAEGPAIETGTNNVYYTATVTYELK